MHSELYPDGIGEIAVRGTIVRVDPVSLSPINATRTTIRSQSSSND